MATKTPVKTFPSLERAIDVLDNASVKDHLNGAIEDIFNAEGVETMEDFKGSLETAAEQLRSALASIERMIARCA